ncbi:MAG: single-stranded-DNA-specific exonuclease RecJ, partial [Aggregatilineales bacterium]
LVITVDCGIRAVQQVEDGNAAGLDIIITDHHSVGDTVPDALAVVNPQQNDCDGDKTLAGVGVAFMVARGLLLDAWKRNGRKKKHLKLYTDLINNLTDLVAIGTVADIMSLASVSNRALVKQGLEVINSAQRPGIRALMKVAGLKAGQITAMDIGFGLGPRINAAGRLESAMLAYELLASDDFEDALEKAEDLQALNVRRQQLTREASERVRAKLALNGSADANLIFAADDEVSQGIVGLVAGRLTEEYYRPAIILDMGETESHASCRSIPEFHITKVLDEHADLLLRHGGHAMAAGFTVANENIELLEAALTQAADKHLAGQILTPSITIDKKLDLRQLDMQLVEGMAILEPTGHKNTQPIFMTRNLRVVEKRRIGKDKSHLKMKLADDSQPPIDTIAFRLGDLCDDLPEYIDIVYHLEVNEWQGRRNLQLNIQDLRPAE